MEVFCCFITLNGNFFACCLQNAILSRIARWRAAITSFRSVNSWKDSDCDSSRWSKKEIINLVLFLRI
jgi:hypothetical protein